MPFRPARHSAPAGAFKRFRRAARNPARSVFFGQRSTSIARICTNPEEMGFFHSSTSLMSRKLSQLVAQRSTFVVSNHGSWVCLRYVGTRTADASSGASALGGRLWRHRDSALRYARMGARSGLPEQSVAQRTTCGAAWRPTRRATTRNRKASGKRTSPFWDNSRFPFIRVALNIPPFAKGQGRMDRRSDAGWQIAKPISATYGPDFKG
jgi:hypothetical protein